MGDKKSIKEILASVENYGKTEGDYAQLTSIVVRDLQLIGKLPKDITIEDVRNNPELYEQVVGKYWKRIEDFGIPDDDYTKAIWWRAPGLYKRSNGDINMISDPVLRNVMQNRQKNIIISPKLKALGVK